MIGRFGGKPDGIERNVVVRTTAPERAYRITTTGDSVSLEPTTNNQVTIRRYSRPRPATPERVRTSAQRRFALRRT